MSDGPISDDELAQLLEGQDEDEDSFPSGEVFDDSPPPPSAQPKVERTLSQADIDALLAGLGN
jgi:hypothetical protein